MNQDRARSPKLWQVWSTTADLVAIIALVAFTDLMVFLPVDDQPLVRAVVGIAFVLFVPGYALVSALFPEAGRSTTTDDSDAAGVTAEGGRPDVRDETGATVDRFFTLDRYGVSRRIDGTERVALAFGLSIALVPLIMVGLTFSPFEFALVPIYVTISTVTVVCAGIAAFRRWSLPEDRRFQVPYGEWIAGGTDSITDADSGFDAVLNVALAVAIVLAVGTLTFAVVASPDGERFTEFYVLTENGDGELVAANHPESFSPDEPELLHFGIENHEGETVEYSIVVQLQRLDGDADEPVVTERAEIDRVSMTLAHNETFVRERELTVSEQLTGENLRLTFLLYDGPVPDTPMRDNAYRSLHLWVDVEVVVE